ncbi:recombinase family protein [Kordia sp.]|uniref:recombinase family protein n=1 Tax=Kordia sp. TaxID=1965332 RepID=UPI003D2C6E77
MNVGIYVRVSIIDKKNQESPEIHENRGRKYAELKGWNVTKVYTLPSISGKSTINHSETKRMLEDIKSGTIQTLIFSKLARLARNTEELIYYSNYFQKYEANMVSLGEHIDTSTASGRLFYTMIGAMGQWERENNLERIMASIETRREMGKVVGGIASHGYKIENSYLVINEEEAPVRKLIYELFLEHKRRTTVARILNERGYRTRLNKKWTDMTVKRLIKNSDAKGIRKSNFRGKRTPENPSGLKPKSEWIFDPCPVIVSEDLWESCNAILREQEEKSNQRKPLNQRVHLFTSYLYCQNNHKMSLVTKTNKYTCVQCKQRIDKDDLEEIFKTRLEQFIISEEEVNKYSQSSNEEIQLKKDEIEFAENKAKKVDEKMDRLLTLNIEGEIPVKGFKKHYEQLLEQKDQIELNIQTLQRELQEMLEAKSSFSEVLHQSKDLYSKWHTLDRPEKRYIVQSVVNRIEFDGKNINFNLKQIAPLSSLELSQNAQHNGTT